MPKARRKPAKPPEMTGDHGTGTDLATRGTVLKPVEDQKHNKTHRRERVWVIAKLHSEGDLSLRQWQAANEIQEAWGRVECLSSGDALKEQVDTFARPDAVIASQIDAQSRYVRATIAVPDTTRRLVEHVCCHNRALHTFRKGANTKALLSALRITLDRVANHLGY